MLGDHAIELVHPSEDPDLVVHLARRFLGADDPDQLVAARLSPPDVPEQGLGGGSARADEQQPHRRSDMPQGKGLPGSADDKCDRCDEEHARRERPLLREPDAGRGRDQRGHENPPPHGDSGTESGEGCAAEREREPD